MLILMAVVLGVAAGLVKRGNLLNLAGLRLLWLSIPSFAATALVSRLPDIALFPKAALLCLSYSSLIVFAVANRRYIWGSALFALGSLSNFTVIAANGFRMPVSPAALEIYPNMSAQAVIERSADYFVALGNSANLLFLGDVIYVPIPLIGGFVSAGDIILMPGMFLLIFTCMTAREVVSMDILIRPMKKDDWGEVLEIYFQGIQSNMATFELSCQSYEDWDRKHLSICRLVAEVDYEVVGWIALLPFSQRECYRGVAELSVYVDSDHKHQGIGEALLHALIEESERAGIWSLQSVIFQENIPSIKLHEKCGFRTLGYRERLGKDRFGAWRSVVLMERRIQTDIAGGCDCDMAKGIGHSE